MMAFPRRSLVPVAFVSAATICFTLPAAGQTVENFYKSHELTILIGHPPGGSYDLYAQLAAAHIGKFIPGHPTVIVQQMPGGGGSKATAHFYNRAPHDGSIIALFPETIAYVQLMDSVQGKWDVSKMRYIGSLAPVNSTFMIRKGGAIKSVQDLFGTKTN